MFTSGILLTIVSSIVFVAEIYTARTTLTHELQLLANTISANSRKPLVLGKKAEIDSLLGSLIYQDNIHAAYFFDSDNIAIAQHLDQHASKFVLQALKTDFPPTNPTLWLATGKEKQFFSVHHLSIFKPLLYQGEHIGTLYLLSDIEKLYGRLGNVALAMILSLLIMTYLAWLLAGWLQKPISRPLLSLTALMKKISSGNDYSFRAEKNSNDEVGILVDGFNQMLEQIERHQASIAEHQAHLEQMVADRTAELRSAIKGLKLARQQADDANQAKSHFLSRITHELRTPLIGVLGMNELLTRTPLNEQQLDLVDTVQNSGQQLLQLIGDVLDFSKIEAGKLELEIVEFDFYALVVEVVQLLSVPAQQKQLNLYFDQFAGQTCTVKGDVTRLRQVLMNLIGNAIKFTATGSVVVNLNCIEQVDGLGTFVLEVEDTGAGITTADKQQIFDIFYQAEGAEAVARGSGLGLAIVKQFIDLMDGELNLFSEPGQGSKFQVVVALPLVAKKVVADGGNK